MTQPALKTDRLQWFKSLAHLNFNLVESFPLNIMEPRRPLFQEKAKRKTCYVLDGLIEHDVYLQHEEDIFSRNINSTVLNHFVALQIPNIYDC